MSNITELKIRPIQYLDSGVGPCNKARRDDLLAQASLSLTEQSIQPRPGMIHKTLSEYSQRIKAFGVTDNDIKRNMERAQEEIIEVGEGEREGLITILVTSLMISARAIELATSPNQRTQSLVPVREEHVVFKRKP